MVICKPKNYTQLEGIFSKTGEFVINIPPIDMMKVVLACSRNYLSEVNEFEMAGLKPHPSGKIKTPGIEAGLAWAKFTLVEEILREKLSLIIGKIVNLEVDERFFDEGSKMDFERTKPLTCILGPKDLTFTYPANAGKSASYA